jgi:hypothetical protein
MIDENQLAQILSQQLKLHYIKPDLLMNVPNSILKLVPKKIALKYQIVPYHKDKGKLFLAMKDTSNLAVIDELSFQLDHIIVPLAIPEIRLMLALKHHYGMDITPRFENIEAQIKYRKIAAKKVAKKNGGEQEPEPQQEEEAWPLLGDEDYTGEEPTDDAYFNSTTSAHETTRTSVSQQLAAANDRNDIARALINFLGNDYSAAGILMVRSTIVTGWLGTVDHQEISGFDQLNIPLRNHSIFDLVISSKTHFLGSITDTAQNRRLLEYFNAQPPQNVLVIPLMVKDRLVSILYIQDSLEILETKFAELQRLARKAEMAFTLLILKNKILTT